MEAAVMTNNALEINNLNVSVGNFPITDLNLNLEKGTIMGLVGKNGSGKTTLIKSILDMVPRKSGEVLFNGIPMYGNEKTVKAKIGVVFDNLIFPLNLKPLKIKNMMSPFYEAFDHEKFSRLMKRFELDPKKKLSAYSRGMQTKFGVVMALCHNPDIIILDEPTAGLDPVARADLLYLLMELMQSEEKSILFSTHITSDLEKIADYITLIDNGEIILSQSKDELVEKYTLFSVEKERMTEQLKSEIVGLRETAFTFEGLTCNKNKILGIPGIRTSRATIEDIMVCLTGTRGEQDD